MSDPARPSKHDQLEEEYQSLWLLTVSPVIWAFHFLVSYVAGALWCAKWAGEDASLDPVRYLVAILTVFALVGVSWTGWKGYRKHRYSGASLPHDRDTPEDRHRFLGFATVLLSALSAVGVMFVGMVAVFVERCA